MGTEAYVLCIGRFDESIKDNLAYPADFYDDTNKDAIVTSVLMQCNTADQSAELAEALGVEVWDFNTHQLRPDLDAHKIQWNELMRMGDSGRFEWNARNVRSLKSLLDTGFLCIYQPNG